MSKVKKQHILIKKSVNVERTTFKFKKISTELKVNHPPFKTNSFAED